MGCCAKPSTVAGASMPTASSTVGAMSMMCAYCRRVCPALNARASNGYYFVFTALENALP